MKLGVFAAAAVACLSLATAATADVVVDRSPDVTGVPAGFTAQNFSASQNFLVRFHLAEAAAITGADVFSAYPNSYPGVPDILNTFTTVRFRADVAGAPDTADLFGFTSFINTIDHEGSSAEDRLYRLHADFTAVALAAGDYWFGMSGLTGEIGWEIAHNYPGADPAWLLIGDALQNPLPNSQLPFRLYTNTVAPPTPPFPVAVPEPATWALAITGFGLAGAALRRRRSAAKALARAGFFA